MIDNIGISELPRYQDRILLHQKYVKEGLSAKKIATELGCSPTAVKKYLRLYDLSKGGPGKGLHREMLPYGKRLIGHALEPHKREGQVVNSIKEMYQKNGLGPTAIARILDTMRVPTKKQGKKWDHSVVKAILEREGLYKQTRKSPRERS